METGVRRHRAGGSYSAAGWSERRTLREALLGHPAGPEMLAVLGALADGPLPASWERWKPARRERYLDAALEAAMAATPGLATWPGMRPRRQPVRPDAAPGPEHRAVGYALLLGAQVRRIAEPLARWRRS